MLFEWVLTRIGGWRAEGTRRARCFIGRARSRGRLALLAWPASGVGGACVADVGAAGEASTLTAADAGGACGATVC